MKENMNIYTLRDLFHRLVKIQSLKGNIVVTRKDDTVDHLLSEGEVLTIRPRGLLAISSLSADAEAMVFSGKVDNEGRAISFA